MNVLQDIPPEAFNLRGEQIESFVQSQGERYGLYTEVQELCINALTRQFDERGSLTQEPGDPEGTRRAYYNMSHNAAVLGFALPLADRMHLPSVNNTVALASVYHGMVRTIDGSGDLGSDEIASSKIAQADMKGSSIRVYMLSAAVNDAILGTKVERVNGRGIHQSVSKLKSPATNLVADADVAAALCVPNAEAWAVQLLTERIGEVPDYDTKVKFLERTALVMARHEFRSKIGKLVLTGLSRDNSKRIRASVEEFARQKYAG